MSSTAFSAPDVIAIGQAVVDCTTFCRRNDPERPEVSIARSITLGVGGDAVNEAIALTSLGCRAAVICALGSDPAGDLLNETLKSNGIDITGVSRMAPPFATPVANIFVNEDGSRSSVNSEATMLPGYRPSADKKAKVVSLASLFRAPLDDPGVIREIVLTAKENGAVICADTKLPTFRRLSLSDLQDVLPYIDFLFPNEREAEYYSGISLSEASPGSSSLHVDANHSGSTAMNDDPDCSENAAMNDDLDRSENTVMNDGPDCSGNTGQVFERMADVFLSYGVGHIVIKAGREGCFAKSAGSGFFHIPALPVKAVNTTGAGDYFAAGFMSALLHGKPFYECCENGILCASKRVAGQALC